VPRPKRHHIVPESYLNGFVDPESDCLHAYDKISGNYWTPKPWNVMVIGNYYRQNHAPEGVDPDVLEKGFGSWIESIVKNSFSKLVNNPHTLTNEDTSNIITYLELQHTRVPRQVELAKRFSKTGRLRRALQETFPELGLEESTLASSDHFRFDFMKMFWGVFAHYFSRMNWEVVTAPGTCSFITSDSPVSFYNIACPPPIEAGIALAGTMVFFPLDFQHLLVLRHRAYVRDTIENATEEIFYDRTEPTEFDLIYGGVITEDQVDRFNYIMLHLSDRIIVGKSKTIIDRIIESCPQDDPTN
jgi:hypothetical protein